MEHPHFEAAANAMYDLTDDDMVRWMTGGEMGRIKSVFLFPNGNVAVCGEDGEQIPELQGNRDTVPWHKIADLLAPETELFGVNRTWIENRAKERK